MNYGASTLLIGSRQERNGLAYQILRTSILEYLLGVKTREGNM